MWRRLWGEEKITGEGRRQRRERRQGRAVTLQGMPGLLVRCTEDAVWPGKEQRGRGPSHACSHLPQIKVEEDFGFEADEALDSSWVSRGPDKLLPYPTLASPSFD